MLAVEPVTVAVRSDGEIENAITTLGREQAGLVLMDDAFMAVHYPAVISSTLANKVPSIYAAQGFPRDGGLVSYGPDFYDIFRRAAGYVDRILKGDKPADLPVQQPTKFELVINLKTAKALGLTVPDELLLPPMRSSNDNSPTSACGSLRLRLRCSDTSAVGAQADIKRGHRECAAATSSRLACRPRPAQQVRQLGYVRHDVQGRRRSRRSDLR